MKDNKIVQKKRITLVGRDDFTKQDVNTALTSVQTYCDELVRNINELKNGEENPPARTVIAKGPQEQLAVNIDGNAKTADHAKEADKAKMAEDSEKLGGIEAKEYLTKDDLEDITNTTVENSRKLGGLAADKYLLKPEAKEIYASKEELTRNIPEPPKEGEKPKEGPLVVTQAKTLVDNAELKNINIKGKLTVEGDIYQTGPTYETHAEDFYTKKDIIHTRDGAETALPDGNITGIVADKYDVEGNYGALGFDKDGVARVGDVSVTKTETEEVIDISKTQAIATREDKPLENGIAQWNADLKRFDTVDPSTLKSDNAKTADNLNDNAEIQNVGSTDKSVVNAEWVNKKISTVFVYKGDKTNKTDLPAAADNAIGDVWYVTSEKALYVWNGESWDELNLNINVENYYTKTEADKQFIDGTELNDALNSYYTKTQADAEFINGTELNNALEPYAKSEEIPDVSGFALTTDITNGTIKPSKVSDGATMVKADGTEQTLATTNDISTSLAGYYTKTQADAEFINGTELNDALSPYAKSEAVSKEIDTKIENNNLIYNWRWDDSVANNAWIKITINSKGLWMLQATIDAYLAYNQYKIIFSGYNYVSYNNEWYSPMAYLVSNMKGDANPLPFKIGRDVKSGLKWVAFKAYNYPNVRISNIVDGFKSFTLKDDSFIFTLTTLEELEDETKNIINKSYDPLTTLEQDIKDGRTLLTKVDNNAVMVKADGSEQTLATEKFVTDKNYITSSALTGYATEDWVTDKKYIDASALTGYATEKFVTDKNYLDATSLAKVPHKQTLSVKTTEYADDYARTLMSKAANTGWAQTDINETFDDTLAPGDYVTLKLTSKTGRVYIGLQQVEKINKDGVAVIYLTARSYYIENYLPADSKVGDNKIASEEWVGEQGFAKSTELPDVSGFALKSEITDGTIQPSKVADGAVMVKADGSEKTLATEQFVTDKGYATQTWVGEQGFAKGTIPSLDGYATQTWVGQQGYIKPSDLASIPRRQTLTANSAWDDAHSIDFMTRSGRVGWGQNEIKETFSTSLAIGDYITFKITSNTGKTYIGLQQVQEIDKVKKIIYLMPRSYYIENALPVDTTINSDIVSTNKQWTEYSYGAYNGQWMKVYINNINAWMLAFDLNIYEGYSQYTVNISGYNYPDQKAWYAPKASLISATDSYIDIKFGRDSKDSRKKWIAYPLLSYYGVSISNVVNAYTQIPLKRDLFKFERVDNEKSLTVNAKGETIGIIDKSYGLRGFATKDFVETRGYQTSSQVEQAITSKDYQNAEQVQKKVDDKFRLSGTTLYIE